MLVIFERGASASNPKVRTAHPTKPHYSHGCFGRENLSRSTSNSLTAAPLNLLASGPTPIAEADMANQKIHDMMRPRSNKKWSEAGNIVTHQLPNKISINMGNAPMTENAIKTKNTRTLRRASSLNNAILKESITTQTQTPQTVADQDRYPWSCRPPLRGPCETLLIRSS